MKCGAKGQIITMLTGMLLMGLAYLMQLHWDGLLEESLKRKFVLSTSSSTYRSWVKNQVPVYCNFYFFNWTNPSDLGDPTYRPEFEEVGPYSFLETLEKVDVVWHNNGTVSYKLKRYWYFDKDRSNGSLTDRITSANPVAVATKYLTRNSFSMSTLTRLAAPGAFHMKNTKTVDELLFTGYDDQLIDLGRFSQMLFFSGSKKIPYDRFGWWYPRNGSVGEVYTIETGENGMNMFGEVRHWKHEKNSGFYNGSCGEVYGSGGNFWPWKQNKSDVALFTADLCRYVNLEFQEELSYYGLPAYRYESGPSFVDNGTMDSHNECFCNGECVPSGVFNASSCSKDAPVFISYPHFQYADPYYTDAVVGMKPNKHKHNIYLILEPTLGVPLELSAKVQINLMVETNIKSRGWVGNSTRRIFFPVLWVDQSFRIRKEDLDIMKLLVRLPAIGFISSIVIMVVGVALVAACLICRMVHRSRSVRFLEIRKKEVNEEKVAESNDKNHIKFNYVGDSCL